MTFGYTFNQSLLNSLNYLTNLTHLSIDYLFDKKFDLTPSIKSIYLNSNNKYIIENLPNSIEELEFGYDFDLELDNLPSSIKKIIFNKHCCYTKSLNNLPNSISLLILPEKYNLKIANIPVKIN